MARETVEVTGKGAWFDVKNRAHTRIGSARVTILLTKRARREFASTKAYIRACWMQCRAEYAYKYVNGSVSPLDCRGIRYLW